MLLETIYQPWRLARAVNQTSSSFVAKLATTTEPVSAATATATSASILDIGKPANFTQNRLMLMPFGTGSDANTFLVQLIGWAPGVLPSSLGLTTWFPTLLCELTVTLSSTNVGAANGFTPNGVSDFFAKTIAGTIGSTFSSLDIVSPAAAGMYAFAVQDIRGFQKLELTFSTGSSATDCNALVRFL